MHLTTYGPPNQCGGIRVNRMFSTNHAEILGACLVGDGYAQACLVAIQDIHF